jgi:hypothetical protein
VKIPGLAQSLDFVATSIGVDQAHAWRLGVTLDFGDGVELFATDNLSISSCECAGRVTGLAKKSIILPAAFVSAVCKVKRDPESWVISQNMIGVVYDGQSIYSRTLGRGEPHKHRKLLESVDWDGFVAIPDEFSKAIESCLIFLTKEDDAIDLIVSKGTLVVRVKSDKGETETDMDFVAKKSLGVKVSARTLLRQLKGCESMAILEHAILLRNKVGDRMVAVLSD